MYSDHPCSLYMVVPGEQAAALGHRGICFAAECVWQPCCDMLQLSLSDSVCARSPKLDQLNFKQM